MAKRIVVILINQNDWDEWIKAIKIKVMADSI